MNIHKIKIWLVGLYIFLCIQLNPTLIWKDIQITWYKLCVTWAKSQNAALEWQDAKNRLEIERLRIKIAAADMAAAYDDLQTLS